MAKRRRFKALDKVTWFRPRRGGKDSKEQKDVPTVIRQAQEDGHRPVKEREKGTKTENGPGKGSGNCSGNGQDRKSVLVETVYLFPIHLTLD